MRIAMMGSASHQALGGFNYITRAPENDQGGGGGGQQTNSGGDYQQGNNGSQSNESKSEDYDGLGIDPTSFWAEPKEEPAQNPDGTPKVKESETKDNGDGKQKGAEFAAAIDKLQFAPAFDADTIAQIEKGDLTGVNAALQKQGQESVRQSVMMTAQILQQYGQSLLTQVEKMVSEKIGGTMGARDTETLLGKEIPAYNKAETQPIVQRVYDQALVHSKGDKTKAITMTKGMLKAMGTAGGDDFGTPPSNPDDMHGNHPGVKSLVADLLTR